MGEFQKPFIQEVVSQIPTERLQEIEHQAEVGSEARMIVMSELARRAVQPYLVTDEYFVPIDPQDELNCESCQ